MAVLQTNIKNNYFDCPKVIRDRSDYFQFIDSIKEYTKRYYSKKAPLLAPVLPFPLKFLLNLLELRSHIMIRIKAEPTLPFIKFLNEYAETYFLNFYAPNEIPLLYAIMQEKSGMLWNHLSIQQAENGKKSIMHWKRALEYLDIYEKQCANDVLSKYSKLVKAHFSKTDSFTMLRGRVLANLTAAHNSPKNMGIKMELMAKSCQYYIKGQSQYSVYSNYGTIGMNFVIGLIKRLSTWDYTQYDDYQKRYAILLRIGMKSLQRYYAYFKNTNGVYAENYVQMQICLGYQRVLFNNNDLKRSDFYKAQKLIFDGIEKIRNIQKNSMILRDAYDFLLWIDESLCDIHHWQKVLKMSMEFNKQNGLRPQFTDDKNDWKRMQRIKLWNKYKKEQYLEKNWSKVLQNRKTTSMELVPRHYLSQWIEYFKNKKSYRIMKNLCYLKECNDQKCRAKDKKLSVCKKCKSVYYCCRSHQKRDWNLEHRGECREYEKRNAFLTFKKHWTPFQMIQMNDKIRFVENCGMKSL